MVNKIELYTGGSTKSQQYARMSLSSAVKAMVRTNIVMSQLDMEKCRLERNIAHVAELPQKEHEYEQDMAEEAERLYNEVKHWQAEVADAEKKVEAWKAELAVSRTQFFSEEEVGELKEEGALAAVLNELERSDASKIPYMLEKHGADFIPLAKWAIKDRYLRNGSYPW